jgi:hypothetical protein
MNLILVIMLAWTPNDISENVTHYTISVDSLSIMDFSSYKCEPELCIAELILEKGSHSVSVTATNSGGTSAPTTIQVSNGDLHRK